MKSDRLTRYFKGMIDSGRTLFGHGSDSDFSNPRRYRLDFIAENTFNRVWTIRFSRMKVFAATIIFIAAIAALMFMILFFTPVKRFLPGTLDDDIRSRVVDLTLSLDSLERQTQISDSYIKNIVKLLNDDVDADTIAKEINILPYTNQQSDSMLQATEAERLFVKQYEDADRFNLSVLTPIAAEVMAFYSPVDGATEDPVMVGQMPKMRFIEPGLLAVSSTYRGTVISAYSDANGIATVVIQHPNDFVSIYSGLNTEFVKTGDKVVAGQRIGHSGNGDAFEFELWHNGSPANPGDYISF